MLNFLLQTLDHLDFFNMSDQVKIIWQFLDRNDMRGLKTVVFCDFHS